MGGHVKAERSEPGLKEESNFGLEGGGKKYERTLSAYARPRAPRFILSHLASCLQHVFLFGRPRRCDPTLA